VLLTIHRPLSGIPPAASFQSLASDKRSREPEMPRARRLWEADEKPQLHQNYRALYTCLHRQIMLEKEASVECNAVCKHILNMLWKGVSLNMIRNMIAQSMLTR